MIEEETVDFWISLGIALSFVGLMIILCWRFGFL